MDDSGMWTVVEVERRLVAAFRYLPGHPVFSDRHRVLHAGHDAHADALNWTRTFVLDQQSVLALLTWARCRATGDSVRERYQALGWSRSNAERARRRALDRIVAGLNARRA